MAMKLRNRLIILNMVVIGATTLLVVGLVYQLVVYQMRNEIRGFLSDEFNEYALEYKELLDDLEVVSKEMQEHFTKARMSYPIVCRVYDESGRLVVVADNAGSAPDADSKQIAEALEGRELNYVLTSGEDSPGTYWCSIRRLLSPSGKTFAFEIGLRIDRLNHRIRRLRNYLLALIPVVLVIGTVGAWLMARRSLQPFGALLDNLRGIRSSSLEKRLPIRGTGDELDRMAEAVNTMLVEVHDAFLRINEFTSDAAHELRTPLARLTVMLERSISQALSSEDARVILDDAYQECVRLRRLIDDLMLLARLDTGEMGKDREVVDLAELIDDLEELWLAAGQERRIDVRLLVNRPLPVDGHVMLLKRLLANLVDNALRYTPHGGLVQVIAGQAGADVEVRVKDTGAGIGKNEISKLFNRFYRVDPNRAADTGGTGLGLSICLKIAELYGGTIGVESNEGVGSTFTVKLPATDAKKTQEKRVDKPHV